MWNGQGSDQQCEEEGDLYVLLAPWRLTSQLTHYRGFYILSKRQVKPGLSVDKTESEPDSGLTRGEAGLFRRAKWSSPAARKGTTLGLKATTQTPTSLCGTRLA